MPFDGSQSIATQDPQEVFEQGFEQLARNAISAEHPELANAIALIKLIDASPEDGRGFGYGILRFEGRPFMVPVVVSDSEVQLADIAYDPKLDVFVPLDPEWLREAGKGEQPHAGDAEDPPEFLFRDVDIRNIVVPPITGRFSYASADLPPGLRVLKNAHVPARRTLLGVMRQDTLVRDQLLATYGAVKLGRALCAKASAVKRAAVEVLDEKDPPESFRAVFGDEAGLAYAKACTKSVVVSDVRSRPNRAVVSEGPSQLEDVRSTGVYSIMDVRGEHVHVIVVVGAVDMFPPTEGQARYEGTPLDTTVADPSRYVPRPGDLPLTRPLVIFPDGRYAQLDRVYGKALAPGDLPDGPLKEAVRRPAKPSTGLGLFLRPKGTSFQASMPLKVTGVRVGTDGVLRTSISSLSGTDTKTAYTQPGADGEIYVHPTTPLVRLPESFSWLPLTAEVSARELLTEIDYTPSERLVMGIATPLTVRKMGAAYLIDDCGPFRLKEAVRQLADSRYMAATDAVALCKVADVVDVVTARSVPPRFAHYRPFVHISRVAAAAQRATEMPSEDDEQVPEDAPPEVPAEPGASAEPAALPGPADLAVLEALNQLQTQQTVLDTQRSMLGWLQQRVTELQGGASPDPAAITQAGGAPPAAPVPGGYSTGQSFAAMGPENIMGAWGQLPVGSGGPPPDQDIDPTQTGPLEAFDPTALHHAAVVQQMYGGLPPQLAQQVGSLGQDDELLDAAALSGFVDAPTFRESIAPYLPDLVRSVDRLARVRLALALKCSDVRDELGDVAFNKLQASLDTTFDRLGDAVLVMTRASAHQPGNTAHDPGT